LRYRGSTYNINYFARTVGGISGQTQIITEVCSVKFTTRLSEIIRMMYYQGNITEYSARSS
jgi:hypothetical protein